MSESDSPFYSRRFMAEFIELYKSLPATWKVGSKDYNNRNKKRNAYDILVKKLQEVDPSADRLTAVKKINNLRSAYRRELRKVTASRLYGDEGEEVYTPCLWYYDLLSFLSETADEEMTRTLNFSENTSFPQLSFPRTPDDSVFDQQSGEYSMCLDFQRRDSMPSCSSPLGIHEPRKRLKTDSLAAGSGEDATDAAGRVFADNLRQLDQEQRIYAERIVWEVMFHAKLKNLSRYTRLAGLLDEASDSQIVSSPKQPESSKSN